MSNEINFFAYILVNEEGDYYKGHTADLIARLREHNRGKTRSIKLKGPFRIFYFEEYGNREDAIKREKYFKSGAGRRYIKKLAVMKKLDETPPMTNGHFGIT